jgi:tetrahydromethanopterin S-methyltransferase subunit G
MPDPFPSPEELKPDFFWDGKKGWRLMADGQTYREVKMPDEVHDTDERPEVRKILDNVWEDHRDTIHAHSMRLDELEKRLDDYVEMNNEWAMGFGKRLAALEPHKPTREEKLEQAIAVTSQLLGHLQTVLDEIGENR